MTRRVATLTGGIAALLLVVASPVAHLDHHLLTAHMAQHLILMLVAAPLILLGARPPLPQPPLAVCWFAGSFTVIFWHIPAIFEKALESHFWHGVEQASFVIAGILFWRPIIGSAGWSAPIYLFLATLPCDALSAFLAFCGHVVYRPYVFGHAGMFGLSSLDDQALAGALMWVAVTFAYLIPALVLTSRLIRVVRSRSVQIGVT